MTRSNSEWAPPKLLRAIGRLWCKDGKGALTLFDGMATEDLEYCAELARALQVGAAFTVAKRRKLEPSYDDAEYRETRQPNSLDDSEDSVG